MAEKQMKIEVVLDLSTAQNQLRTFAAANNRLAVPVASPVGATVPAGSGVASLAGATGIVEQPTLAAAMAQAEGRAAMYSVPTTATVPSPARGGGGFLGVPRAMSLLFNAGFGLREVGVAASGIRNAEALAAFANTPEEANLLRAEAVEKGSEGFFGSLIFGLPNAFGIEGSPAQVAQQARQSVAIRKAQDETRARLFDIADARSYRSAYTLDGRRAAEDLRSESAISRQIDQVAQTSNDLRARLNDRTPAGDFSVTGEARSSIQGQYNASRQQMESLQEQLSFEHRQHAQDRDDYFRTGAASIERARMLSQGASRHSIERYDLNESYRRQIRQRIAEGGTIGFMQLIEEAGYARAAQNAAFRSEDQAAASAANRAFTSDVLGLNTSNAVISAQLNNNPLQAQLTSIRGQQQAALNAVTEVGIFGDIRRGLINKNAALQEQLATRNFERATSDINRRLDGAVERAQLGLAGGPTRFARQQISGLLESTDLDVRGLEDQGRFAEADKRRDLGRLQLRGAEADFYRSIQYGEASPRGVYGTGTLGGIRKAFSDAEAAVGESGRGDGAGNGGWSKEDAKQALTTLDRILTALVNGITGTAG